MKKSLISLLCLVFLVVLFAALGLFAADAPEKITLEAKNGNITFPHTKHVDELKIECGKCHHTAKENVVEKKCGDCHGVDESAPKVMKAFHNLCKACHKERNEKEGKAAPTKCNGCHVKA